MKTNPLRGESLLLLTAVIWGTSFVAQRVGMKHLGPYTFTAVRFFIGALALLLPIQLLGALQAKQGKVRPAANRRALLTGGIACGLALFAGISFQQVGLQSTGAGKAGFITALYILLVPLLGLFLGKKVSRRAWLGVGLALVGLYLLTVTEELSIARGDFTVLCGTIFWAAHILIIDHFSPKVDGLKLAQLQFLVAGALSAIVAACIETVSWAALRQSAGPLLYSGIVVVGIAYTLQVLGQKYANPTLAAILLSLEAVFAVISGMLLLGEGLTLRELTGCVLMLAAVLLAEVKPGIENQGRAAVETKS